MYENMKKMKQNDIDFELYILVVDRRHFSQKGYEMLNKTNGDIHANAIVNRRHLMSVVTNNGSITPNTETKNKCLVRNKFYGKYKL